MNKDSFRRRLKRLHDAHHRQRDGDGGPSGVYSASDPVVEPAVRGWAALGAKFDEGCWVVSKRYEASMQHGAWTIGACGRADHEKLAELEGLAGVGPKDLLYMDTETTGLGEGALAFMVGVGFWEGSCFVVEQFLMEEEGEEPALLKAFSERLAQKRFLVTFNGRRFDGPLLSRRFRRWGLKDPLEGKDHLDLLYISRRQFSGRRSYRLASLEEGLLGFRRVDDVPGAEIPGRWARFVRDREAEPMAGVLEHNRLDIVSMAALLAKVLEGGDVRVEPVRRRGVQESLKRSYRLRGEFAKEPEERRRGREVEASAVVEDAVEARALELKGACAALFGRGLWQEAFGLICEYVALKPDDRWGLTALGKVYREVGREELARALERRSEV